MQNLSSVYLFQLFFRTSSLNTTESFVSSKNIYILFSFRNTLSFIEVFIIRFYEFNIILNIG